MFVCAGVLGLEEPLSHLCLLDELFFWVLKYEFPQKLVTLLLSMLPDEAYKVSTLVILQQESEDSAILYRYCNCKYGDLYLYSYFIEHSISGLQPL